MKKVGQQARQHGAQRQHGEYFQIGPGRVFVHFALRKNSVANIVANARQPRWEDEGWAIPAEVSELLELYRDFHPQVLRMIESIEPGALFKWGLRDREALPQSRIARHA